MDKWDDLAALICMECGGKCCIEAKPPLTRKRIETLCEFGCPHDTIDSRHYKKLRTNGDGYCVMYHEHRCSIHGIKPETCIAGPFTFDVRNNAIEIYLKKESICPLVRYIKERSDVYERQYTLACANISTLVQHLPAQELQEILRIDEPETEKVAEIPLMGPIKA
ncbi:MAG: YkgJ family cysteine cluster protein [Methanomicrobiales archaeon]|nr:YkgJ family cysteine cluster protein [Methanomicrobiales archaeon]